jgi:hypothetical protein
VEAIAAADAAVLRELRELRRRIEELERRIDELAASNVPRGKAKKAAKQPKADRIAAKEEARAARQAARSTES